MVVKRPHALGQSYQPSRLPRVGWVGEHGFCGLAQRLNLVRPITPIGFAVPFDVVEQFNGGHRKRFAFLHFDLKFCTRVTQHWVQPSCLWMTKPPPGTSSMSYCSPSASP